MSDPAKEDCLYPATQDSGNHTQTAMTTIQPSAASTVQPSKMEFAPIGVISEEACKKAMINMVAEECCYGSNPAKKIQINGVKSTMAFHYILDTFCETRSINKKMEIFQGQAIDGPENGVAPGAWAIPCVVDLLFQDHIKRMEVPHTATIQKCSICSGSRFVKCKRCGGLGKVRCTGCGGSGVDEEYEDQCRMCHGTGRRNCYTCSGEGKIYCETCQGQGQFKCYDELVVHFKNHKEDHVVQQMNIPLPDEMVRDVKGDTVFEQQLPNVWPIQNYPVPSIVENSVRLVNKHRNEFLNERQIQQRQTLRAVPVTEVACEWKDWKSRYWVYGEEHQVYCPDYPQTCCWGCHIV